MKHKLGILIANKLSNRLLFQVYFNTNSIIRIYQIIKKQMINPPHTSKKRLPNLGASRSQAELVQASAQKQLTLNQLLNIDSVLPAPKAVLTGKHGKQKLAKEKYRHLASKKQVYKMDEPQAAGRGEEDGQTSPENNVEMEDRAENGRQRLTQDPFGNLLPKGSLRERSWKQPPRGLTKTPEGVFTIEELKILRSRQERQGREDEEDRAAKRGFKIKKVKMTKGQELARIREDRPQFPLLQDEDKAATARLETDRDEDQPPKLSRGDDTQELEEAYPAQSQLQMVDRGSRNAAGPAFGNQLLGSALQLPGPAEDYNMLCTMHKEDQLQSMFRTSKSAHPKSPKQGSQPLSTLSLPPGPSEAANQINSERDQRQGLTQRDADALKLATSLERQRAATATYMRPRLKRFNSLNEVQLDSQGSRPLDPDAFVAKKRVDIELANYQTRKAIEKLGETSRESAPAGQMGGSKVPAAGKPSKQHQVQRLLQEIERDNTLRKMKEQDLKTAQLLRLINSMMAEPEDENGAETAREMDRVKGEIMQVVEQIQSKEALTSLAQQLLQENGFQSARGSTAQGETQGPASKHQLPLIVKPPLHKPKTSPTAGRDKRREFQTSQNEKIMALIQEFTEREKAADRNPNRDNMTQSRRLLTFLQKNLLFEQNKLGEQAKESKAQIEEEIERDLQYLNVFIQPIQSINIFNKDNGQQIEVRKREEPEEAADEGQEQAPLTFDDQLKELILNSPLRPLVDSRILELQRQVETKETLAAKTAAMLSFQQQSKVNQGPAAASQAPCQTPAYLQMQALSEVLDTILMCEQDTRGREAGKVAQAGKGAAINISQRDEKMLNPIQQEELRRMKQVKYEIAEQLLPQLLPLVGEESNEPRNVEKDQESGRGPTGGVGSKSKTAKRGYTAAHGHPALKGIDVGQQMLSDHKIVFEMDRIYTLQSKLDSLVADVDNGGRLRKEEAMTFLTEHYPVEKVISKGQLSQKQASLLSLLWPKSQYHLRPQHKQAIEAAKEYSEEEQQKNDMEELKVTDYHLNRRQQLTAILDKIDKAQADIKRIAEAFTISGSQKQTLLYLSFVECARQIAKHSKMHAMLITRIFHEYFSMTQKSIRSMVAEIHSHLQDIARQTEKLIAAVKKEYHNHLSKDIDTAKLKQDFNKTIEVMEFTVRNLYLEEARRLSAELKLDMFGQNLKLVFPHAAEYLLEKNVDNESYIKEEMKKREEHRQNEVGSSQALVRVEEAGAAERRNEKQKDAAATVPAAAVGQATQQDSDRVDIVSKSMAWNEQVQRFRRRIVKFYRVAGYRHPEAEDPLDNRARPSTAADEAPEPDLFADQKTRHMHEKLTQGRSWGRPHGDYQVPGAAFAEQQAATDEIYELVLADIDRLLAVVPIKTELEKRLEAQAAEHKQLARQYAQMERAAERHEKDLSFLQARCSELTQEIVERQTQHLEEINQLKKSHQEEVARVAANAKEAAILELQVPTEEAETMTVVDGEAEKILRQREFNQKLLQYRGANRHYKEKAPPTTKQHEEDFARGAPPVEHCYFPIAPMIRQIRQGRSKYQQTDLKSVKNVLKMVAGLLQAKITAMGKQAQQDNLLAMMNVDSFYYHHMQQTYGLDQLANKYCEIYLASIEAHRSKDTRLELFRKFVGLDIEKLPYSIFEKYVTMIKATNIPVQNLFTMALNGVYVEYPRVRYVFKEMLSEASDLIHKQVYQQLQSYSKVVSGNPTLGKYLELEEYEVFRDLQDQTIRSRFKTNAMMLKSLFMELNIQTDELDSDSEDERGSSQAPKFVTKRQFVEFLLSNYDLTDYSRGNFNCSPKKTVQRVEAMVDKIFILAQGAVGDAMTPRQMMSAFREKIEIKLPVAAFFHIGINACALHENDENQHYEQVYQFYSQCDVEWDDGTQELVARNVHLRLNMEGMSYDQFMLFLVDTHCPLVADGKRQAAFEVFKMTCESKNRAALLCEDFLEAIRKYRLLPTVEVCERAMHDREILIAKELRIQMVLHSEPVPAFLAEAASRKLTAEAARPPSLPAGRRQRDQEDEEDEVEALKREQADIQKKTAKQREEMKQEHQERQALEKVQGLAKLSELTGASRRRTFKSEVLAEFRATSAGAAKQPNSLSQSPTLVKSPSSASLFDQPGSAFKDQREAAGPNTGARPGEKAPPDGSQFTVGVRPQSESPKSQPEGKGSSQQAQPAQRPEDAPQQESKESRANEPDQPSQPVGVPEVIMVDEGESAEGILRHRAGTNGSLAVSTPTQRRTVLIKADAAKQQPQGQTNAAGSADQDAGQQHREDRGGPGKSSPAPGGGKSSLKPTKTLERSQSDDEYGSDY